ncbi:transcriptional regulator BetI [Idiomarina sp. PL1-037]|uniref:transcriptional regulator BetI n=1 Tax=Idiomarina TaxID=135575 RepID=UPI00294AC421|nr:MULTISPECIES: transcriptional regulator BetI [unclassified Idiomarina]MDV6328965.1 transcriptional regulator BetI [Idiomarina sp. Sol25]WQC52207.1 transcriptional regulator BetI [Idiomarina sp. PL1-037]
MPKVGMESMRRQQLIDATINVVADVGLKGATINLIARRAGMSSGIISHYFGGKQALIEASVRYLLSQLKMENSPDNPYDRLMKIVDLNFSDVQQADPSTKTWLSFWGQSMHDTDLYRLQELNKRRLVSNLRYSYKQLLDTESAKEAAEVTAALIDGFWLRCALSRANSEKFRLAKKYCKKYINGVLEQHGVN